MNCDSSGRVREHPKGPTPPHWLITASNGAGLLAICVRAVAGGSLACALEDATLFVAAAYLAYRLAHHENRRELLTLDPHQHVGAVRVVQLAPRRPGNAVLDEVVI